MHRLIAMTDHRDRNRRKVMRVVKLCEVGNRVVMRAVIAHLSTGRIPVLGEASRPSFRVVCRSNRGPIAALEPTPGQLALIEEVAEGAHVRNRQHGLTRAIIIHRLAITDHRVANSYPPNVTLTRP